MARSFEEAPHRPSEALQAAEYLPTEESAPVPAEPMPGEEDRTFAADRQPLQADTVPAASKTKKLTIAAAVFAAAGITLFVGLTATSELLRMQQPSETTAVTETTESTEASVPAP